MFQIKDTKQIQTDFHPKYKYDDKDGIPNWMDFVIATPEDMFLWKEEPGSVYDKYYIANFMGTYLNKQKKLVNLYVRYIKRKNNAK